MIVSQQVEPVKTDVPAPLGIPVMIQKSVARPADPANAESAITGRVSTHPAGNGGPAGGAGFTPSDGPPTLFV